MRVVEDDYVDRLQVYRQRCHSRVVLIARTTFLTPTPLLVLRTCSYEPDSTSCRSQFIDIGNRSKDCISTNLGGNSGRVPPLPIPNREVKPARADGTALCCGRVGRRLLKASWYNKYTKRLFYSRTFHPTTEGRTVLCGVSATKSLVLRSLRRSVAN